MPELEESVTSLVSPLRVSLSVQCIWACSKIMKPKRDIGGAKMKLLS